MIKVFIIRIQLSEAISQAELDGIAAQGILNILGITSELRFVLDRKDFGQAMADAKALKCNLIHLSCHGDEDGIALANNYQPRCDKFADFFQAQGWCAQALVGWALLCCCMRDPLSSFQKGWC